VILISIGSVFGFIIGKLLDFTSLKTISLYEYIIYFLKKIKYVLYKILKVFFILSKSIVDTHEKEHLISTSSQELKLKNENLSKIEKKDLNISKSKMLSIKELLNDEKPSESGSSDNPAINSAGNNNSGNLNTNASTSRTNFGAGNTAR
jgi:hypothetical protein